MSDGRIQDSGMCSIRGSACLQQAVARYNPDGSAADGFGSDGMAATPVGAAGAGASTLALRPDGRILVAGTAFAHGTTSDAFALACFTPAGKLDLSFANDRLVDTQVGARGAAAQPLALQPDGRLLAAC